ncbi:glycoside hydrolase family 47 protein [Oidiodendron maius Zn]|uniref:alpha-1,2-Mannosidase n=1 Tax=Oidiodendron maius (strain Zn) TaxID=913774 RepID=A0A0C3HKV8_OIDMZ|nr:glycoside hydrolase family 47 protein [Oidiodendron maius Zn]
MDYLVKSSFDWSSLPRRWPVTKAKDLPKGKPHLQPRIQADGRDSGNSYDERLASWRKEVKATFLKSWRSYKEYAWMRDELAPISGNGKDTYGGWAATLIDNLDTLWIMDLKEEFIEAVEAVAKIDWANTTAIGCNVFETTIRHLGGLLAAYDLSGQRVLLIKATELGNMLYAAFDTPTRLPPFWLHFETVKNGELVGDVRQPSASPGSLSLEFTRLSQLTGDPKYYDAISRITDLLAESQSVTKIPGIWPKFVNTRDGQFRDGYHFTLGALADSLYEYLPKMHAMLGTTDAIYELLAKQSLSAIKDHILFRPMLPGRENILFSGNAHVLDSGRIVKEPQVQHLSCFTGGMFGLAGRLFDRPDYVDIGVQLTCGCIHAYNSFATGIAPEIFTMLPCPSITLDPCDWDEEIWRAVGNMSLPEGYTEVRDAGYLLRPEAIESIFVLYRVTGRREFSDMAHKIFLNIQKATETEYGNAAIDDVRVTDSPTRRDSMESFWLSETLKYFYLIFSPPELISLDDWVLNTEAHPLKRLKSSREHL